MYYLIGNYTIEELLAISLESWIAQAIEEKKKRRKRKILFKVKHMITFEWDKANI